MKMQTMRRVLSAAALISAFACVACFAFSRTAIQPAQGASAPDAGDTALVGIWEMTVQGNATYHYKYAISVGTWVANGDVDKAFYGYQFSPTTGAYEKNADGSYRYRERGWTYNRGGVCNGSFESTGTFVLDASGNTISGPGVFKQFDLAGNLLYSENFTAVATRVGV